jgi:endonuclease/exonuclease/phosphatase family metal-dependent hydrolase
VGSETGGRAGPPRWALLAAAVAVAVAGVGALLATSAFSSPRGGVRLLQFNMCGHVCRDASTAKVAAVAQLLADVRPAAVALNEVCRVQLAGVVAETAERGWAMNGRFIVTQPDECGSDGDYGLAVLTRARVLDTDRLNYAAQVPGNPEHRGLLCVAARLGGRPTRICTTHVVDAFDDPVGDVRRTQIVTAARRVDAYRLPVVLLGDLNVRPRARVLGALYTAAHGGGAHGRFDEVGEGRGACRCGAATHGRLARFDYIFVRHRDFTVVGETLRRSPLSDHRALIGQVTAR